MNRLDTRALPAPEKVMDRAARLAFVLGLIVLAFAYGFVPRGWKLPPYYQLKPVGDAVEAVRLYFTDADYLTFDPAPGEGGVTVVDEAASRGLTFVSRYDGEQFGAELLNLQGRVVHRWNKRFSDVWGESAPHVQFVCDDKYLAWHGVHLYPDGSVLFNFEGLMFPFGGGLIKLRSQFGGRLEAGAQYPSLDLGCGGRDDLGPVGPLPARRDSGTARPPALVL